MIRLNFLLIFLAYHSATLSEDVLDFDYQYGLGYGLSYSDNVCDNVYYKCDSWFNSYNVYYEMIFPSLSIRSSLFKIDDLSYNVNDGNIGGNINHLSLELLPTYNLEFNDGYSFKLGLGANIWKDDMYDSHLGISFVNSVIFEKYFKRHGFGLGFNINYYPNHYNSSSDLFSFGFQIFKLSDSWGQVVNHHSSSVENYDKYLISDKVVLYFDNGSTEIKSKNKIDSFENGDYIVIYGYRSYNEDIIVSIQRARVVQDLLMEKYPDSRVEVVNMSYSSPDSYPYSIDGIESERRVVIISYNRRD